MATETPPDRDAATPPDPGSEPGHSRRFHRPSRRTVGRVAIGAAVLFLLIQVLPWGHKHTNPPATKQVGMATAAQKQVFAEACRDCHSNDTDWLWYTKVAPISWLVMDDVKGGRARMNLSEWDRPQPDLDDVVRVIDQGSMPPIQYKVSPYHWNAILSSEEKKELSAGFRQLYADDPPTVAQGPPN
jgi:hypothetical protein